MSATKKKPSVSLLEKELTTENARLNRQLVENKTEFNRLKTRQPTSRKTSSRAVSVHVG
ncbi:MAG: hypothetical protein PUP46_02825 [Endozoicomonas sp. (ex Botrylloides leachii)]|nr:hypothetical protein [Endozoicomonas sp. (ex Botrylloides leachii)]